MHVTDQFEYWYLDQKSPLFSLLHHPLAWPIFITASVVPSILGHGYQSPQKVFRLMTGQDPI